MGRHKGQPPPQLKISPVAAISHKSRAYRLILNLSFWLRLDDGGSVPAVIDTTTKTATHGACDQLGHSLKRIIHAFGKAGPDEKIMLAKWDIQDGFWRLHCCPGEEWNFAYVLPQPVGEPIQLVIPTSLQMGWIESPPYFCMASETGRDMASDCVETPLGSLPKHKFEYYSLGNTNALGILEQALGDSFCYVYVDDFISLIIPKSCEKVTHVARTILHGIHDIFPAKPKEYDDPISSKKLQKGDGTFDTRKCLLGFNFDGEEKPSGWKRARGHSSSPSCTGS